MNKILLWARRIVFVLAVVGFTVACQASELVITSFGGAGQLVFDTLDDGNIYVYRVEWAPTPSGPWSTFEGAGSWMDSIAALQGGSVTSTVPMFYRVIAHLGDYMAINLLGGPAAESYPVTYYRMLADVPGGPNSDYYKTNSLLMRRIPKGVFMTGSPENELGRQIDETQRQVALTKDYYIGVFQVTQKQWERVMGDWPSWFNDTTFRDARPIERVSYYEIRENPNNSAISPNWPLSSQVHMDSFMGKLRAKTGLETLDLPTEAQWERACRAGTGTALHSGKKLTALDLCPNMAEVGRYYDNHPGGYSANSNVSTDGGTAKVGSYLPNVWGLYDMHGNVFEWCLDRYELFHAPTTDPLGSTTGQTRVRRGGNWSLWAWSSRSATRSYDFPDNRYNSRQGFRLARPLP